MRIYRHIVRNLPYVTDLLLIPHRTGSDGDAYGTQAAKLVSIFYDSIE